jgi:hypothetical protein
MGCTVQALHANQVDPRLAEPVPSPQRTIRIVLDEAAGGQKTPGVQVVGSKCCRARGKLGRLLPARLRESEACQFPRCECRRGTPGEGRRQHGIGRTHVARSLAPHALADERLTAVRGQLRRGCCDPPEIAGFLGRQRLSVRIWQDE